MSEKALKRYKFCDKITAENYIWRNYRKVYFSYYKEEPNEQSVNMAGTV